MIQIVLEYPGENFYNEDFKLVIKKILLITISLLLTACGGNFSLPPANNQSQIIIHIQGQNDIVSSLILNTSTVESIVPTKVANGYAALRLNLTDKGAKALYNITSTSIGDKLSVYWDNTIINQTIIQSPLGGSTMQFVLVLPNSSPVDIQQIINTIKTSSDSTLG